MIIAVAIYITGLVGPNLLRFKISVYFAQELFQELTRLVLLQLNILGRFIFKQLNQVSHLFPLCIKRLLYTISV